MNRFLWVAVIGLAFFCAAPPARADGLPATNAWVLYYANASRGYQVGNGECWTLADYALWYAGAQRPGTGGLGVYQFGRQLTASDSVYPGDVVQFEGCYFYHQDASGWSSNSLPHHTAIVYGVYGSRVTLLNENVGGDKRVQFTTLDFNDFQQGSVTWYRPMPRWQ